MITRFEVDAKILITVIHEKESLTYEEISEVALISEMSINENAAISLLVRGDKFEDARAFMRAHFKEVKDVTCK